MLYVSVHPNKNESTEQIEISNCEIKYGWQRYYQTEIYNFVNRKR